MFSHKYYSVILQVLSDTRKVVAKLNIVSGKFFGWPDARKKQQFWSINCTGTQDDLSVCGHYS
jgi:hypothetical protein